MPAKPRQPDCWDVRPEPSRVAAPGDVVEISGHTDVDIEATISRTYATLFRGSPLIQGGTYVTAEPELIAFDDSRGLGELVPEPGWKADGFSALAAPSVSPSTNSPQTAVRRTDTWDTRMGTIGMVGAIILPSGAAAVIPAVYASRVTEGGMALSVDSRIYVLPPDLLELCGPALRLEAPTGRIPTPTGRGTATTVSLLVVATPG